MAAQYLVVPNEFAPGAPKAMPLKKSANPIAQASDSVTKHSGLKVKRAHTMRKTIVLHRSNHSGSITTYCSWYICIEDATGHTKKKKICLRI